MPFQALKSRTLTAVLLVLLLIFTLFFLPRPWPTFAFGLLVTALSYEWAKLLGFSPKWAWLYAFSSATILALSALTPAGDLMRFLSAAFWCFVAPIMLIGQIQKPQIRFHASLGLILLPGAGLACFWALKHPLMLLTLLLWGASLDIAAYFVGQWQGKTPILRNISPKKSLEGALGALALSICIAWVLFHHALNIWQMLFVALAMTYFALLGDAYESHLKRCYKVKDSGNWLKGHGGLLDRFDSAVAILPTFAFLVHNFPTTPLLH